jgi:hypothetical protein|tara:strand:- start:876 stop:1073 length:198 start_codon:yes stop_codon:yes gene_type:complete
MPPNKHDETLEMASNPARMFLLDRKRSMTRPTNRLRNKTSRRNKNNLFHSLTAVGELFASTEMNR